MANTKTRKRPHSATAPHSAGVAPGLVAAAGDRKGMHRSTRDNQYAFEINPLATKDDVRRAVEDCFDVKVTKVRTQNRKGKPRRYKFRYGSPRTGRKRS